MYKICVLSAGPHRCLSGLFSSVPLFRVLLLLQAFEKALIAIGLQDGKSDSSWQS